MNARELIEKLRADKKAAKDRFDKDPKNRELFRGLKKEPEEFKDNTFLFIRATGSDNGVRPLPSNTVFWHSPDIELYDSSGAVIATNELTPSKSYTVKVKVHNEGDMNCNACTVELFICSPTIGFDRLHATQIGIQSIPVMGHNQEVVDFIFSPDHGNLGHQCLFARAYSYSSGDMPNSANGFDTFNDRHIGQQNISIVNQGAILDFLVVAGDRHTGKVLKINMRQNPDLLNLMNFKLIEGVTSVTKENVERKFRFYRNIDPGGQGAGFVGGAWSKFFLWRLILYILSLLFGPLRNRTKFIPIEGAAETTWKQSFDQKTTKVSLQVPYLAIGQGEAAGFEVVVTSEETGESVGGFSIIVTR